MRFGSLFAGIGGMDLGLERAGMQCAWQVEIDEFCRKVLTKHWPNVPKFNDVRECGKHNLEPVDLIVGGFPCQPFSSAGNRRGAKDDRHLWPEMLRIIKELRPAWVLGENVAGIIPMALDTVLADLEGEDYDAQAFVIPACAVNALHRRNRVWICAHTRHNNRSAKRQQQQKEWGEVADRSGSNVAHANGAWKSQSGRSFHEQRRRIINSGEDDGNPTGERFPDWAGGQVGQPFPLTQFERPGGREVERNFCGVAYGVSRRVDRLRSLGNAVVPQIVEEIGKRILCA